MATPTAEEILAESAVTTSAALGGLLPGPWGTAFQGLTGTSDQTAVTAPTAPTEPPPPPIERTGVPYLFEVVGPKGAPMNEKTAILFGSVPMGYVPGMAVFLLLALAVLWLLWYLLKPAKKKKKKGTSKWW